MLVACQLAGPSALEAHNARVSARAQFWAVLAARPSLPASPNLAPKIRRLARNSRHGDDDAVTSSGHSYHSVHADCETLLTMIVS